MAVLSIQHLSKTYKGGKRAVNDLSLTVEPGDIFGFIGHNGAGKTTTLRAVAGILDFEAGEIQIDGHDIRKDPLACKRITAYVPDNPELYDYMTGIQYLNFLCDVFEVDRETREAGIRKYAEAFELMGNLGDLISSYSHGMKQKLTLIGALVHEPKLIIFDEPFVGLDPKAVHTVKEIMFDICAQGRAVFFSTHVLDVAEKLCNKIAIIRNGELVTVGGIDEVRGDESLEDVFLELLDKGAEA